MYKIKLAPYTMEISFTNNFITESDVIWFVAMIIGFILINLSMRIYNPNVPTDKAIAAQAT